jgi:hypothetical protein
MDEITKNTSTPKFSSHTERQIEEAYNIAVSLGFLEKQEEHTKRIFKGLLYRIASTATDECRSKINELLFNQSNELNDKT